MHSGMAIVAASVFFSVDMLSRLRSVLVLTRVLVSHPFARGSPRSSGLHT